MKKNVKDERIIISQEFQKMGERLNERIADVDGDYIAYVVIGIAFGIINEKRIIPTILDELAKYHPEIKQQLKQSLTLLQ